MTFKERMSAIGRWFKIALPAILLGALFVVTRSKPKKDNAAANVEFPEANEKQMDDNVEHINEQQEKIEEKHNKLEEVLKPKEKQPSKDLQDAVDRWNNGE